MYDRPFRWWVQSVMPVVFDNSLSYYEVLAKLTKYIEGLTGDVDQIEKILETIEGIEDITQFTEMLEQIKSEIGNLTNLSTQSKSDLVSAINEVALKADIAYWKPPTGIPESDLSQSVQDKLNRTGEATKYIINNKELKAAPNNNSLSELGIGTYTVPSGGIPWDTLSQDVQDRINAGGGGTGGTSDYTDLSNKPQINGHTLNAGNNTAESLGLGTYSKPNAGIPESDLSAEVQEKLNTSGGIADNQQSFVASRDYEAGELLYINGILYKTKYKILAGTTMIPGNNIETTDISAELEKINSDIDSLQSGAGPDSWSLVADVTSTSTGIQTRFFEYFNAIGGETYNFVCTPAQNNGSPYQIRVRKRDGTIVFTSNVLQALNQERFSFTPTDTGEYYCDANKYPTTPPSEGDAIFRVELEYTESQGISELWTQVNAASQLEPRVSALETLVGEQQSELDGLDGIPVRVTAVENKVVNLGDKLTITNGSYQSNAWGERFYSLAIKVNANDKVKLTTGTRTSTYGGLKSFAPNVGDAPDFSAETGWTSFHGITENTTIELTIPADVEYLYLYAGANTTYDRLPIEIVINDIDLQGTAFSQLHSIVENYGGKINEIETELENYDSALSPQTLTPYGLEPQHLSLFKYTPNLFSDFCYHIVDGYYTATVAPPGAIRITNAPGWQGWLIALKPNTTYVCGPLDYRIYFFDKNYIYTERIQTVNNADNNTFTTGENSVWVAITQRTTRNMEDWMLVEGDTYPEEYSSGYPQWVLEPSSITIDKKIAFMGDSITAGVGATKTYHEYLHDKYHFTCLNYGYGGAGFYRNSDSQTTGRIGMGIPGRGEPTTPENFFTPNNVVARLQELDSSEIDGIVIFAGTNDYGNNVPMEDYENAIEDAFTYCYSNLPLAPILVLTPIHRRNGSTPNSAGHTLRDYVDALIEKCKKFGVAYIDTMTMSGIYPDNDANRNAYFSVDTSGLHPDYKGHKRIASVVGSMLKDMIDYTSFN